MSSDWTDYQDDNEPIPPLPGLGDRGVQPGEIACDTCKALRPWSWWTPPASAGRRWRGRWCPPPDRCPTCTDRLAEVSRRHTRQERQRRAAIPPKLRGMSFASMVRQPADESPEAFRERLRGKETLGVTLVNADAWHQITSWRPSQGGLLIAGPVGTGKSAAAACLALRELGEIRPASVAGLSDDELLRRYGDGWALAKACGRGRTVDPGSQGVDVLWTDEGDLLDRQQQASTLDRDPKKTVAEAGLLIYDDLGAECGNQGKRADYARDLVARLVRYRYDRRLPMIVTSNLDVDELAVSPSERRPGAGLDARTVDRLTEMLRKTVRLGGESWRK